MFTDQTWITLFPLTSLLTMPFWFLMIFLPTWKGWTKKVMSSLWVVVPAALTYALLIVPESLANPALMDLANPTLEGIQKLLGTPAGTTIGWVHFLAFDLFVGRWAYLDNQQKGTLPAWVVSIILVFVLMLGPLGLCLYLLAQALAPKLFAK